MEDIRERGGGCVEVVGAGKKELGGGVMGEVGRREGGRGVFMRVRGHVRGGVLGVGVGGVSAGSSRERSCRVDQFPGFGARVAVGEGGGDGRRVRVGVGGGPGYCVMARV